MITPRRVHEAPSMLDTLAIKLKYPAFEIMNPGSFSPAFKTREVFAPLEHPYGRSNVEKYVQNAKASDRKQGICKPNLTGYRRFDNGQVLYELIAEVSVPKFLNGENVSELEDADLDLFVRNLHIALDGMGVRTSSAAIRQATVVRAHFAKNIPLPRNMTVQDALEELRRADLGKAKHITEREYRDGSKSLHFYAASNNIIFYDKKREVLATKRKGIEKEKLGTERSLLNDSGPELLRFEVRIAKQQTLVAFLSQATGEKVDSITLEQIFKRELCQKILLEYWHGIADDPLNQLAFKQKLPAETILDFATKLIEPGTKSSVHTLNKVFITVGLGMLIREIGVKRTRNKIEKYWSQRAWVRKSAIAKELSRGMENVPPVESILIVSGALDRFERYVESPDKSPKKVDEKA